MVTIEGSIDIALAPEDVFDVVADEHRAPDYNPTVSDVVQLSPGPVAVGTRWTATTTQGSRRRRPSEITIVVTSIQRPRRVATTTWTGGMTIEGAATLEPVPGGTRVHWRAQLCTKGWTLLLLTPLLAPLTRRQEAATWRALKQHLEGSPDGADGADGPPSTDDAA